MLGVVFNTLVYIYFNTSERQPSNTSKTLLNTLYIKIITVLCQNSTGTIIAKRYKHADGKLSSARDPIANQLVRH